MRQIFVGDGRMHDAECTMHVVVRDTHPAGAGTAPCVEIESPVGPLLLAADAAGLRRIVFLNGRRAARPADHRRVPQPASPPEEHSIAAEGRRILTETIRQLRAYFSGDLESFSLPLAPEGTPFQLEVWRRLCDIPFGETMSYGELARLIHRPGASRAVGLANGSNPIPVVIPCHRVIGSNGKLTGYGGGLPIKEKLLALERRQLRLL
jgi:methylated-DNA-[protein]-cysteine S-methyltransferase